MELIQLSFLLTVLRIYLVLSVLSVFWFIYSFNIYTKCRQDKVNLEKNTSEYDFCKRVDYCQVSFFNSFFASLVLCPPRFVLFLALLVIVIFSLFILKIIGNLFPVLRDTTGYKYVHILIVKFVGSSTLWLFGVTQTGNFIIKTESEDYSNCTDKTYIFSSNPPPMDKAVTIVSNHISMLDISFFMKYIACGFVAQEEICRNYVLGTVADIIGCIYVDRSCRMTRVQAKRLIKEKQQERYKMINSKRIDKLKNHKRSKYHFWEDLKTSIDYVNKDLLVIFPEGTTTNGTCIIPFKTGAFESLTPVQPVVLCYNYSAYSPAFDIVPFWALICLLFCNYGEITLSAYWLPIIYPDLKGTGKDCVRNFMESVRNNMCQTMNEIKERDRSNKESKGNSSKIRETELRINFDKKKDFKTCGSLRMKREYIKMLSCDNGF